MVGLALHGLMEQRMPVAVVDLYPRMAKGHRVAAAQVEVATAAEGSIQVLLATQTQPQEAQTLAVVVVAQETEVPMQVVALEL